MDKAKKHIKEGAEGESSLKYHIRMTKIALNPNNISAVHPVKETIWGSYSREFGFGTGPIARRYLWLTAKLTTLYLAKGFSWLLRGKQRD